jgi:hypothetical protein
MGHSEIRKGPEKGQITMTEQDYRGLIVLLEGSKAENSSLRKIISEERASFDVILNDIKTLEQARLAEREAAEARIKALEELLKTQEKLVKHYKAARWIPGLIGGVKPDDGGAELFIGAGWKLDLF